MPFASLTNQSEATLRQRRGMKHATENVAKQSHVTGLPRRVDGASKAPVSRVLVVGGGDCGQLGLGQDTLECNSLSRVAIPLQVGTNVRSLAVGGLHCMALTDAGEVLSWGCNDDGALGRDGDETTAAPLAALDGIVIETIACGDCHSAAIAQEDGALYTWGVYRDGSGHLGFEADTRRGARCDVRQREPTRLILSSGACDSAHDVGAAAIACGAQHTAAIGRDGTLFTWGAGEQGQLGRRVVPGRGAAQLQPRPLPLPSPRALSWCGRARWQAHAVACGAYHTFALARPAGCPLPSSSSSSAQVPPHASAQCGTVVFAWGLNNYGQLGLGDRNDRGSPELVEALGLGQSGNVCVTQIAAGEHHSTALTSSGAVLSFGRGDSGQLGVGIDHKTGGPPLCETSPVHVEGLPLCSSIACGGNHTLAVGVGGKELYSWGFGDAAQLANGADTGATSDLAGAAAPTFEERIHAFYMKYNPEKAGNAAKVASKYAGQEAQLFAALRARYDVDSDSDDEGGNVDSAVDEMSPHLIQQRELHGGDVGRVLLADGGGQHTVVLVEVCEGKLKLES